MGWVNLVRKRSVNVDRKGWVSLERKEWITLSGNSTQSKTIYNTSEIGAILIVATSCSAWCYHLFF